MKLLLVAACLGAAAGCRIEDRTPAGTRRDCGDFTEACASGYTYPRVDSAPRATADQYAAASDETIYVVFEQTIPGTETPTGTTFVIGGFGRSQGPILMDPSLTSTTSWGISGLRPQGSGMCSTSRGRRHE